MKNIEYPMNKIEGLVRVFRVYSDGSHDLVETKKNQITYGAADILSRVLTGNAAYNVDGVFFEFEQLAVDTDPITTITPTQTDTFLSAYSGLGSSFDVFNAPLLGSPVVSSSGANYTGNRVLVYSVAATAEPAGLINAISFSSGNNSALIGASLAVIDTAAPANSILFSRVSLNKLLAQTGVRVGLEWTLTFT